jgi:hypothetical protein
MFRLRRTLKTSRADDHGFAQNRSTRACIVSVTQIGVGLNEAGCDGGMNFGRRRVDAYHND